MAGAIQDKINTDIANIPIFYGDKAKDTITLTYYISRLDQGVSALEWTDAQAYTYFANSTKGTAANWIIGHLVENDGIAKHWSIFKPAFRLAFGDITDHTIFASDMGRLNINQFNGNLIDYHAAIATSMTLHLEQFADHQLTLPAGHGFTAEQIIICRNETTKLAKHIHNVLRKEFFINGLTKKQIDKIANKPELTTAGEMVAFLKRNDEISKRQDIAPPPAPAPAPAAKISATEVEDDDEVAAFAAFQAQRLASKSQQRGRGQGGYRGRGSYGAQRQNGNGGNSGNGQNGGQKQETVRPFCVHCRIMGHKQEVCRRRIADNAPCFDAHGAPFYPKNPSAPRIHPVNPNGEQESSIIQGSIFH